MARSSALKMSFENELGALPPTGYWDPLGLSAAGDAELDIASLNVAAVVLFLLQMFILTTLNVSAGT